MELQTINRGGKVKQKDFTFANNTGNLSSTLKNTTNESQTNELPLLNKFI